MKDQRGFTLLELLMVVVIIAILASIAVPQYLKTTERARMSEALTNLSSLRQSAIRFKAEVSPATWLAAGGTATSYDFTPGETSGVRQYGYTVFCITAADVVFAAKRLAAGGGVSPTPASCVADYTISIDLDGNIVGRNCQDTAAQACS